MRKDVATVSYNSKTNKDNSSVLWTASLTSPMRAGSLEGFLFLTSLLMSSLQEELVSVTLVIYCS